MSPSQPHSCWLKINFLIVSREFTIQKPTKAKRRRRKFSRKSLQAVKKQIKNSFTDHESDELHRSWKCLSLSRDYQHENLSCDDKKVTHTEAPGESHIGKDEEHSWEIESDHTLLPAYENQRV